MGSRIDANLVFRCGSADIQKVGGSSPVHFDDVHSSHRKASAIDHAPDVAVQSDVIEVSFTCCHVSAANKSSFNFEQMAQD